MTRILRAFLVLTLALMLALSGSCTALANIDSYSALLNAVSQASDDDILIISGVIAADESDPPLSSNASLIIRGVENSPAELVGVRIDSMNVGFSNIVFSSGLEILGNSNVQLMSGTLAQGRAGRSGIAMTGSGTLQIDRGSAIAGGDNEGGQGGDGILLTAVDGEIALIVDGSVVGGLGRTGGSALTVSGLGSRSSVSVGGVISGGKGTRIGGNALNLYDSADATSVQLSGTITGGTGGRTGGSAVQIVNATDHVSVELSGSARGGDGAYYGGDTLVAMNVSGSLVLSGQLRGGDVSSNGERPGAAVRLLDMTTTENTNLNLARLEDGQVLSTPATPIPAATPVVAPTAKALSGESAEETEPDDEAVLETTASPEAADEPESTQEPEATHEPASEEGDATPCEAEPAPENA